MAQITDTSMVEFPSGNAVQIRKPVIVCSLVYKTTNGEGHGYFMVRFHASRLRSGCCLNGKATHGRLFLGLQIIGGVEISYFIPC